MAPSNKKSINGKPQKSRFQCFQCKKHFGNHNEMMIHVNRHKGLKPYSCGHCDEKFKNKPTLLSHELKEHKDQKGNEISYQCSICGMAFRSNTDVEVHEKKRHQGPKPYPCSQCDQIFLRKGHLKQHTKSNCVWIFGVKASLAGKKKLSKSPSNSSQETASVKRAGKTSTTANKKSKILISDNMDQDSDASDQDSEASEEEYVPRKTKSRG